MGLPSYKEFYKPLLTAGVDKELNYKTAMAELSSSLNLSDSDLDEQLKSGGSKLKNRIGWAVTYLAKAKLMERTGSGKFKTTEKGRIAVKSGKQITDELLKESDDYRDFIEPKSNQSTLQTSQDNKTETPEEVIDCAYEEINSNLESDLLAKLLDTDPNYFEQIIVDVLTAMGYGGGTGSLAEKVGRSGDGGIDGIINEDPLGLEVVYIQAKRYNSNVGEPDLRNFVGSLDDKRTQKGVFVTTSDFTTSAISYSERSTKRLILISGKELVRYMIKYNVGVRTFKTISIKNLDEQYFEG